MDTEGREGLSDEVPSRHGPLGVLHNSDYADEGAEQQADLEWLEELEDEGDFAVAADSGKKRSYAETARMFKLRRNLDQLDCFHRQKEHDVQKARESLKQCHHNVESLMEQRDNLEREIEQEKAAENSVAVFRLRAQHRQLCQKLQSEEELEGHMNTELKQLELELNKVEVEISRFATLRQEVEEEEEDYKVLKAQKASVRLKQEKKANQKLQLRMQKLKEKQAAALKKEELEYQRKIEDGRTNRKIAVKFLKETIKRMQQQEDEKEQKNRELLEKRIQAVKSLKSNIAATQESLRVQQSRAKANTQKKEQQQRQLRESLQAQGINSIKYMYQQKQLEKINQQQAELEEKQKLNRVAIVAKILQEEKLEKNRKRNQVLKPNTSITNKFLLLEKEREKLSYYLDPSPTSAVEERTTVLREFSDISSSSSASSDSEDLEEPMLQEVDSKSPGDSLAEPEFCGLWDENYKKLLITKTMLIKTDSQEQPAVATERLDVPVKKVHGKELKGPPFISKPDVVLFKDFDVGKMYKKKILLTNTSYTTTRCKFVRVSGQIKDFISIHFDTPGSLSVGMSCELQTVFQPTINEDMEGEVQFVSAVGPFSVPVRCTIKKCDLVVDSHFIDFGSHVVGEKISRTITLTNKGALGTFFSLVTVPALVPETGHLQMSPRNSASNSQETSNQNTVPDNQKSSASIEAVEPQSEPESQEPSVEVQHDQQAVPETSAVGPEVIPDAEECVDQSLSDSNEISLGNVREGEIGPFQSTSLEVFFNPTIPGEAKLDFYIEFSSSSPIPIKARGVAVSIPVWVVEPNIDLKICMFDYLYQDTVIVQSRARSALKLTFEVCPDMRKHMEVLPKTGFIQAESTFNAQLKFLPRRSLSKDGGKYFDRDTGVLEVPMTLHVAGQVQPIAFTVHAVVTSSDLQFDQSDMDFGYCSIYQSVKRSVRLTNLSLLPQDFGFLAVPEFLDVQPNDGFGTLLPHETLEIDLIFSASRAREYSFQLTCKSGVNRDFPLNCRAVGVRPPLELSHSLVQFGATAVGDRSATTLYLINKQANATQSKQQAASTPRLFSFALPEHSEIHISPSAGRLLPGERCLLQVVFRPRLMDQEIREEALRLHHRTKLLREKELERKRLAEQETKKETRAESTKGRKAPSVSKTCRVSEDLKPDNLPESPDPADIQPGSELYEQARTSLLHSFNQRYSEFTIPCFISDGDPPEEDRQAQPAWSSHNTLYLKLQCLAVQPPLVVISNNGHNVIDFQQVAVGDKVIRRCTVQNISTESVDLSTSVLDTGGSFLLLNALRCMRPGEKHTLILAFNPTQEKKYCETLEVRNKTMSLEITLVGEAVFPAVTLSQPESLLDFGYVMENESRSHVLKLHNNSRISVGFKVLLDSVSPSRCQGGADKVALLLGSYIDSQILPGVGTQNYSGLSVFSAVPIEGSIAPGQSQEVTVLFQPDHSSLNYSDKLTIELTNKSKVCVMDLKGAASSNNMYLCGADVLTVPIESLLPPLITCQPQLTEPEVKEKHHMPLLVTMWATYSGGGVAPATRELHVGCINSPQTKKSVEFYWDSLPSLQQQGFSVEPIKGSVEAGEKRIVTITWTPQSGYKPYEMVKTCVPLTLKGNETQVYRVTLMAAVSVTEE